MKTLLLLLAVPAVLSLECKLFPAMPKMEIDKIAGWWYLHFHHQIELVNEVKTHSGCLMQYWRPHSEKSVFALEAYLPKPEEKKNDGGSFMGMGYRNSTDGTFWFEMWNNGTLKYTPYNIVDTDYSSYMVLSFCYQDNALTWIVTRNAEKVDGDTLKSIELSLKKAKISMDQIHEFSRSNCPN